MFIKLDLGKEKVCSIEREGIITVIDHADYIEIGLMMGWINEGVVQWIRKQNSKIY